MHLPTLYSRTNTGAIQTWIIEVDGDKYRTHYGQLDGAIQSTSWTVCSPMNVGRANQRSGYNQAMSEAKSAWKKKCESGYHEDLSNIDVLKFIKPMLAKNWNDYSTKAKFPVYTQPKLDGARCIISTMGAFSRNGKPWCTIPHILEELQIVFQEIPDLILDGELYNHSLRADFNKIMSLIKKLTPSAEELNESRHTVQFHCYDICDNTMRFSDRSIRISEIIKKYNLKYIIPVATYKVDSIVDLNNLYGKFLMDEYEGQMVRLNDLYEFKRSATLLKRKEFQSSEYKILDIVEGTGNRSGMAGNTCHLTKEGNPFKSNIKGTREYMAELLQNKHLYIGKLATIVYFGLTPDELIPRFPFIHSIRDYE